MYFLFIVLSTIIQTSTATALTCKNDYAGASGCANNTTAAGDCATLGFSTEDTTDCEHYIYCPFNTTYKACVSKKQEDADEPCTLKVYEDLAKYIGNAECPIVTVANDIDASTIADKTIYTLSKDQVINGNNHTLNMYNQGITMSNGSEINNLNLSWKSATDGALSVSRYASATLSNTSINVTGFDTSDDVRIVYVDFYSNLNMQGSNDISISGEPGNHVYGIYCLGDTFNITENSYLNIDMKVDSAATGIYFTTTQAVIDGEVHVAMQYMNGYAYGIRLSSSASYTINGSTGILMSQINEGGCGIMGSALSVNGFLTISQQLSPSSAVGISGSSVNLASTGEILISQDNISGSSINGISSSSIAVYGTLEITQFGISATNQQRFIDNSQSSTYQILLANGSTLSIRTDSLELSDTDAGIYTTIKANAGALLNMSSKNYSADWKCILGGYTQKGARYPSTVYWQKQ